MGWSRGLAARGAALVLVLGLFVPRGAPPADAQEVRALGEGAMYVDYDTYWAATPELRSLSEQSLALALELHREMDALREAEKDPAKVRVHRAKVKSLLEEYRARKARLIAVVDTILHTPPPRMADVELLRKLRDTELIDISWNKRKFIDCLRDVGRALKVDFVMHYDVNKFNTVEMDFPRQSADGILRTICAGFESEYIIHNGEICIIKKLKRNDERLLRYFKDHPEWKYWEPEPETPIGEEDDL